jgi:hypothetical protein
VALRKAHIDSILFFHNHCHLHSFNSAFMTIPSCSYTIFDRFAARNFSLFEIPVDEGVALIPAHVGAASPQVRRSAFAAAIFLAAAICAGVLSTGFQRFP